jgi:GTP-binding protein HflX
LEKMRQTLRVRKERAILICTIPKGASQHDDLVELKALAESAGAVVVDKFRQKISSINPSTYIGKGKAQMLAERVRRYKAEVVIFDNDLSPGQIRELEKLVGVKVLDRSELILDIFASRAKTHQAKLQVELAQLEYTYPRLTRMWLHLDTVAGAGGATAAGVVGGIGTRGPGEKQLEIDRRLVNKRITELKRELAQIDKRKLREIKGRKGLFKVCLVGYTNAGKSTLMNALTDAGVHVEDRLFATLDTRTRRFRLEGGIEVLLSDTVGFVRNLPHQLIASFKATLEEAVNADLLLHVVDVSSSEAPEQIESVNNVLGEIGCMETPILILINKTDILSKRDVIDMLETLYPEAISISAKTGVGLEKLYEAILRMYRGAEVLVRVRTHQRSGKVQTFLRSHATILGEHYLDGSVVIEAKLGENQITELRRYGPDTLELLC